MMLSLGILVGVVLILLGGMAAVSYHYRTPQVRHTRDPGSLGIDFEEISFPTVSEKHLYGWWIPADGRPDAPTLILVHGWGRNVQRMLPFIEQLHPAGFNLLAFDARSHGSSDADGTGNMLKFSADIRAALDDTLRRGADPSSLGVLGLSVGGAAAIHAAARDERIGVVITVGAFANPGDVMRTDLRAKGIPDFLISAICRYVAYSIGSPLDVIAPERHIPSIKAPVLLVHGDQDTVVPVEHGHRLMAASGSNTELLLLSGRGHSNCNDDPLFWQRVVETLNQALRD